MQHYLFYGQTAIHRHFPCPINSSHNMGVPLQGILPRSQQYFFCPADQSTFQVSLACSISTTPPFTQRSCSILVFCTIFMASLAINFSASGLHYSSVLSDGMSISFGGGANQVVAQQVAFSFKVWHHRSLDLQELQSKHRMVPSQSSVDIF